MSDILTFPGAPKPPEAKEPEGVPGDVSSSGAPGDGVQEGDGAAKAGEVVPTPSAPRAEFLGAAVEAVLFAVDRPLPLETLQQLLGDVEAAPVRAALSNLRDGYLRRGAGIRLHEVAGGFQLRTAAQARPWVSAAQGARPFRLSKAAVETLSIVAYRQPVTRSEVDDIRGVDSGGILRSLLEKQVLRVMGKKDEPGRPLIYGTTPEFLELFGLRDLSDLPTLRDLRELERDDGRAGPVQLDFPDF